MILINCEFDVICDSESELQLEENYHGIRSCDFNFCHSRLMKAVAKRRTIF